MMERRPGLVPDITLVEFLRARLAEDEQLALAAEQADPEPWTLAIRPRAEPDEDGWVSSFPGPWNARIEQALGQADGAGVYYQEETARHLVRHGPARVLREVEAKRRIVQLHEGGHECSVFDHNGEIDSCRYVHEFELCSTLRLLALPFDGHPDYRAEEWALAP